MTKPCRTELIVDSPADADAFGPHERVARSLAEMITSQEGGKSIALEGGWGAGKSTVVRLLQSFLASGHECALVVFDAWAHQGDPLRRTFLESLIGHARKLGWIAADKWTERLESLAHRRKVTQTRNVPILTGAGKALAASLFFVAPGTVLLGAAIREEDPWRFLWYVVPGVLLTVSPLIVLLVAALSGRAAESWALFVQRQVSDVRSESIETPEPTSLEFEHTFVELMQEALVDAKRRLAIVVDNLDRVAPEDARSVWATLQTFLQRTEHKAPDWFRQLWILVPYDRFGLSRIWKAQEVREPEDDGFRSSLSDSFLDKTFQVRFEIPAPVLSRWRPYLDGLLKQALPDHNPDQFHDVYRVFELRRRTQGTLPTPRELKLYVNEIGAIHRQWQDEYPLSDIAYYVLLRREGIDVAAALRGRRVPGPEVAGLVSPDARDHLAALAFNVDVGLGRQLLLQEPILGALSDGNPTALKDLAEFPGFWEVLESVLDSQLPEWAKSSTVNLASAARSLSESGILQNGPSASIRSARKALHAGAAKVTSWTRLDAGVGADILALAKLLSDQDTVKQLLKSLTATQLAGGEASEKGVKVGDWVDAALVLVRGLRGTALDATLMDGIAIPAATPMYIETCSHLAEADPTGELWQYFRSKAPAAEISQSLAEAIKRGEATAELGETVRVIAATRPKAQWADVMAQATTRLSPNNPLQGDEVVGLAKVLWELKGIHDPIEKTLAQLASNGHLHHHMHTVTSQGHAEARAWLTFTILNGRPGAAAPPGVGNSAAGHNALLGIVRSSDEQLAKQLTALVLRYQGGDWFFKVLDAGDDADQLMTTSLKQLAGGDPALQVFQPQIILERWEFLRSQFGDSFVPLLKRLADSTDLVQKVLGTKFNADSAGLYVALVQAGVTSRKDFATWCVSGLNDVPTTEWIEQLSSEGELIDVVTVLSEYKVEVALTHSYEDALLDRAKSVLDQDWGPKRLATRWADVLVPLRNVSIRRTLRSRIYDLAAKREGEIPASFFDLFGSELGDRDTLAENNRAVSQLFTPILVSRNGRGLRWLRETLEEKQDLIQRFKANEVEDFKGRIAEAIRKDPKDEASADVLAIARAIGLDVDIMERDDTGSSNRTTEA